MHFADKRILRALLFTVIYMGIASFVMASTDPPLTNVLKGSKDSIYVNAEMETVDVKYFALSASQKQQTVTHLINNFIGVGIEEENEKYIPGAFSVTVVLEVTKFDKDNVSGTPENQSFLITYDTATGAKYNSLSHYSFTGAFKVKVKIISIDSGSITWPVSKVLKIQNTLIATRDYPFDCYTALSGLSVQLDVENDELFTTWEQGSNPGQNEYDLEWAWVDESATDNYKSGSNYLQNLIFENNSTRVSITGTSYKIPLLYDDT